jgi:hypothetical protein
MKLTHQHPPCSSSSRPALWQLRKHSRLGPQRQPTAATLAKASVTAAKVVAILLASVPWS